MTQTLIHPGCSEILSGRKDLDRTRYSYKLSDAGQYGLDIVIPDQGYGVDESRMSAWIPFASGVKRDGVGDLIEVGGIDCSRHMKNPICLLDHGKGQHKYANWPIALAEDRDTRAYTVEIDPVTKTAKANAFFYQGHGPLNDKSFSEYCEQIFDLWCKRFIRAGSIGYQVKAAQELRPDYQDGVPAGLLLLKTLLLEVSAVVLPANSDTVVKLLDKSFRCCGKPLSPYLVKSLSAFAPEKKVSLGYVPQADTKPYPAPTYPTSPNQTKPHFIAGGSDDKDMETVRKVKNLRAKYKGGSTPRAANVSDFQVGDKVVARSYLSFIGSDGRTGTFAKPGDRLTIVGTSGPMWLCRRDVDGMEAPFGSVHIRKTKSLQTKGTPVPLANLPNTKIPPSKWKPGAGAIKASRPIAKFKVGDRVSFVDGTGRGTVENRSEDSRGWVYNVAIQSGGYVTVREEELRDKGKSLTATKTLNDVRKKYRTVKGLRRRLKKSAAGSSMLHVSIKDVDAARKLAESKGLKFQRMGENGNAEKIKLTGPDEAIDAVAKEFGRVIHMKTKGTKSLNGVKALDKNTILEMLKRGDDIDKVEELADRVDEETAKTGAVVPIGDTLRWAYEEYKRWKKRNKSMPGKITRKVKAAPDDMNVAGDLTGDGDIDVADVALAEDEGENAGEEQATEKYSAQVLRRMHEDATILLEEYEEMRGPLENEGVDGHLQKKLETLVSELEEIETLFAEHHPDSEPLGGGTKDFDEGGEEDSEESDDVEIDDDAVAADSSQEDEPTPEEALEGMETKDLRNKYIKVLRTRYQKSMCKDCGKADCKCDTKALDAEQQMDKVDDIEEVQHKALEPHEKQKVGEASEFLKEIGTAQEFSDEHRMKSYHFHKSLDPMGTAQEQMDKVDDMDNVQHKDGMNIPNPMDMVSGGGSDKSMHRKAIGDASRFLKNLSTERNFGDNHRSEAMNHHKALDPIAKADDEAEVQEGSQAGGVEPPMVGEMGEKRMKELKRLQEQELKNNKLLFDLANTVSKVVKAVG